MKYRSSRGGYKPVSSAEAIKMGISPDGGLFVPDFVPRLDKDVFGRMEGLSYQERTCIVMEKYLSEFSTDEIEECIYGAYNQESFDDERIAPVVKISDNLFIQELWHGPTCAFKDMALQILPHLLTASLRKTEEKSEILILVATSGDTGKAALEGFKDVAGTRVIVFFPEEGVSEIQKYQMITQEGQNVYVAAVRGNFDDAQTGVKEVFASEEFAGILSRYNIKMSSANSINWGRLLPQIVYYVSAYVDLKTAGDIREGETINIAVPTGNFGNILAAYYAGKMGVPINKLICASNSNNVLADFIKTGVYDSNRRFHKTISPSMDILISSNLERLLYEVTDHDYCKVANWMEELKCRGRYVVDEPTKQEIQALFWADFCSDPETIETIRSTWLEKKYLLDTHTAVAVNVCTKYREATSDASKTVVVSTASPFKFAGSVAQAIIRPELIQDKSEFEILELLASATGIPVPAALKDLDKKKVRHNTVTSRERLDKTILSFLNIESS